VHCSACVLLRTLSLVDARKVRVRLLQALRSHSLTCLHCVHVCALVHQCTRQVLGADGRKRERSLSQLSGGKSHM
jgi:hypothetical protein